MKKKHYFLRFSEFYNDDKNLLDYNCPKKEDFIKKGIGKCYSKAERLFNILTSDIGAYLGY